MHAALNKNSDQAKLKNAFATLKVNGALPSTLLLVKAHKSSNIKHKQRRVSLMSYPG